MRTTGLLLLLVLLMTATNCQSNDQQQTSSTKPSSLQSNGRSSVTNTPHIPCFVYHRFGNSQYPSTNISLDTFEAHLRYLKENNFTVFTLGEAVQKLIKGANVPAKSVVLTVDDAYKSFLEGAMPLLQEYGFPATLFVNTETVGGGNYLDWDQLQSIRSKGIEIGNHSHSHAHFVNTISEEGLDTFLEDARQAQELLKKHLGEKPMLYAYPYGEYTQAMQFQLKELGIVAAAAQKSGVLSAHSDLYAIPRFPMATPFAQLKRFKEKAQMKSLPVEKQIPSETVINRENPPLLELQVAKETINPSGFQCFAGGSKEDCTLRIDTTKGAYHIRVQAKSKLRSRRTLYTVTAPSKDGIGWHWYSHLWIRPDQDEPH